MSHRKATSRWRQRRVRNRETTTGRLEREFARLSHPNALVKMPFGRHEGQEIATVPPSYLRWFLRSVDDYSDLKQQIAEHLKAMPKRRRRTRSHGGARR